VAQQTVTVCDVDSRRNAIVPAVAHVRLDLDGDTQEYDLCQQHLDELRDALDALLRLETPARRGRQRRARKASEPAARTRRGEDQGDTRAAQPPRARKVTGDRSAAARRRTARSPAFSEEVRRWAREQGLEVKDRGRIPNAVIDQYRAVPKESRASQS
jgi:hypothetical protein